MFDLTKRFSCPLCGAPMRVFITRGGFRRVIKKWYPWEEREYKSESCPDAYLYACMREPCAYSEKHEIEDATDPISEQF